MAPFRYMDIIHEENSSCPEYSASRRRKKPGPAQRQSPVFSQMQDWKTCISLFCCFTKDLPSAEAPD